MKRRSINQRLRFHLVYDESISSLSSGQQKLIKERLIPQSLDHWQETLQVRETVNNIQLQRRCVTNSVQYRDGEVQPYCVGGCANITKCGETTVPASHLDVCRVADSDGSLRVEGYGGEGVARSDFILYVSAAESPRCAVKTTVAYSASCQLETAFDRPVAGYVNLCPGTLYTHSHHVSQMRSTIKHEILHALGFSAGLYAFYRDSLGNPRTQRIKSTGKPPYNQKFQLYQWDDTTIKTVIYPRWKVRSGAVSKKAFLMVTPKVKEEVRRHFNCSTLIGAELEDQDVIGTALSHWEKRLFENEAMTGTYTQNPLFSRLTLALLEDSGWYSADYSRAEPLGWGAGLGCDFVHKSCMEWITERQQRGEDVHPFCTVVKRADSVRTECTRDRQAVAICNLGEYAEPLPIHYQYFSSLEGVPDTEVSRYGGSVLLADHCPYIQEFSWELEGVGLRHSHCAVQGEIGLQHNYLLEEQGAGSVCLAHSRAWRLSHCQETLTLQHWGSGCYQVTCNQDVGLIVHVHNKEYVCPSERHVLHITVATSHWLHSGTIVCPSCQELCGAESNSSCPDARYSVAAAAAEEEPRVPCISSPSVTLSFCLSLLSSLLTLRSTLSTT